MSIQNNYQTLFAYAWSTNRKLREKAALLEPGVFQASPGPGRRSLHDLFFHLLAAQIGWRIALETGTQPGRIDAVEYPDLPALEAGYLLEEAAMNKLLGSLYDARIASDISLTTRRGHTYTLPYWRVLQHLILHAMQHHTEIAQILTDQDQSPGDIDFIFYR
jgi:uncharacterized damage-inducible protein DinB